MKYKLMLLTFILLFTALCWNSIHLINKEKETPVQRGYNDFMGLDMKGSE